ncbi:MAG: hypothetical protein OXI75_13455 [Rhodospirillales bacterium]|nr:hypothetical protein [Rhodospirillales bacterium]
MRKHTAIDKLQEARRIFGSAVEASQSLVEETTALVKDIASLRAEASGVRDEVSRLRDKVSGLHDELDGLVAAVAERGRVLRRAGVKMIAWMAAGGFLGALLGNAAAQAWQWLFSR